MPTQAASRCFPKFIKFTLHYSRLFRKNPEGNWDFFAGCTRRQWQDCDPGGKHTPLGVTRFGSGWSMALAAQGVSRREYGGAAALGSPFGGAGERSETERAQAVASLHIGAVIAAGDPLRHGFQPCQLSHRESQGAGVARPAQRNHPGKNSPASRKNPPAWDWRTGFLSNWLSP